jgi:periplasmic nitrate reductase NapE
MDDPQDRENLSSEARHRHEFRLFVFLIVFLFPILAVIVVGGYGFAVWMSQILMGPPGPGG